MHTATVLVVDDSPDIRELLRRLLSAQGYHVLEAADGNDALSMARRHRPDVIMLDLCLPGLDGWEAARRIRAEPALEEIPIIAVTGYALSSATQAALDAGCHCVLAKPFDLNEIVRTVETMLASHTPTHITPLHNDTSAEEQLMLCAA